MEGQESCDLHLLDRKKEEVYEALAKHYDEGCVNAMEATRQYEKGNGLN